MRDDANKDTGRRVIVPHLEPEVVEAEARKHWRGEHDKMATTSLKSLKVLSVDLHCRYAKPNEYQLMVAMVEDLPELVRRHVASIFCNSKAMWCFSVTLRHCGEKWARLTGRHLSGTAYRVNSRHNGITGSAADGSCFGSSEQCVDISPGWRDYDLL